MSTTHAHTPYDDRAYSNFREFPSYDLSAALGDAPQYSSLYRHDNLHATPSSTHPGAHSQYIPPEMYSSYLPQQDQLSTQQYLAYANAASLDLHHPHNAPARRPPSPRSLYPAASSWQSTHNYPVHDPTTSAAFLQDLQSVIDSSHTAQTQHANHLVHVAQQQQAIPSQSSWTLSGSLDPSTGVFQRAMEHPRLRTAQACEKCRTRKAKCSGDQPCQRCVSRGLQCEYAPERKMRGPNKNKRKPSPAHEPSDEPPKPSNRARRGSVSSTMSSCSDGHTSGPQSDASPVMAQVNVVDPSSVHSSPAPPARNRLPTNSTKGRRRAATVSSYQQRPAFRVTTPSGGPHGQHAGIARPRPRPPPLNLTGVRDYAPQMLAGEHTRSADQPTFPAQQSHRDSRPTSLPQYLLESYSRIALHNLDDVNAASSPGMSTFLQSSPADALSVYTHTPSNSSDPSAPITPLSLTFEGAGSLQYPEDVSASDHTFGHFAGGAAPEQPFGGDLHLYNNDGQAAYRPKSGQDAAWDVADLQSHMLEDVTPRASGTNDMSQGMRGL
ncbi:hypothetical protein C8Q74DRAFT_142303 [Fomes fomentarius]|nr:hypothetical protein C8Q74DRAFT_142303 [Fomes fomentarius]